MFIEFLGEEVFSKFLESDGEINYVLLYLLCNWCDVVCTSVCGQDLVAIACGSILLRVSCDEFVCGQVGFEEC